MQEQHPCYYPGEFAPPTKMHLNALFWLLSRPEVSHVHVVLGKDNGGPISQEQKARLWEMLLKSTMAPQASIIKSKDNGPLSEVYSIMENTGGKPAYMALDEKAARNKKLQKKFDKFPYYGLQLVPSQFFKSSDRLYQAVQNDDRDTVKDELPSDFSDASIDEYMSILKQKKEDAPLEDKSPLLNYKEQYTSKFNDSFWKNVFNPLTQEN